jgi:hypothetical protein
MGWHPLARFLGINVKYIYDYIMLGIEPENKEIRFKLGIPKPKHYRTINDHMAHDDIKDLPPMLLYLALVYRS